MNANNNLPPPEDAIPTTPTAAPDRVEPAGDAPGIDTILQRIASIESQFHERSIRERMIILVQGLRAPRGSRQWKEAITESQRLLAPVTAFVLLLLVLMALTIFSNSDKMSELTITAQMIETQELPDLDDIDIPDQPPDPTELVFENYSETFSAFDPAVSLTYATDTSLATVSDVKPISLDSVATIKSPVIMRGIYAETRSSSGREQAMRRFGGDLVTEMAVMRALRWLKVQQNADGGWKGGTESTGLALLAFLAHGEVPGDSAEFGDTVQGAIEYLLRKPNHSPMATHALAEAYGMTMHPAVRELAENSLKAMIAKLVATRWGPGRAGDGTTRPNLLDMAFQSMALRSAKLSRIDMPRLEEAVDKLKEGFRVQSNPTLGGFASDSYGAPGPNYRRSGTWHFMIGVVGMQYLEAYDDPVVERTMRLLDKLWPPPTLGSTETACCPIRSNYWSSMVFFNVGGARWEKWNRDMKLVYVTGQEIEKGGYVDHHGRPQEIGYWHCEDQHIGLQPIMPTCYIVQQLMVYYRYLPTGSKSVWEDATKIIASMENTDDIRVDTGDL